MVAPRGVTIGGDGQHEEQAMEKAKHETKSHETAAHDEPTKGEVNTELHELTTELRGGLTKLSGPKAEKAITHWQTTLEGLGDTHLKAIATDLGKLKALVGDAKPDGAKIAKSLSGLGDKVEKVAGEQTGVVATALKSLAGVLHKGSESLTAEKA